MAVKIVSPIVVSKISPDIQTRQSIEFSKLSPNTMIRIFSCALLLIILSVISLAVADEVKSEPRDYEAEERLAFESADLNKDGTLSKDELRYLMILEATEEENDSFIERLRNYGVETELSEIDKNGDGEVSKDEYVLAFENFLDKTGELEDVFTAMDRDKDGALTWAEFYDEMEDTDEEDPFAELDDNPFEEEF